MNKEESIEFMHKRDLESGKFLKLNQFGRALLLPKVRKRAIQDRINKIE